MIKANKKIILHAGDYCFEKTGTHIHTLLGSCVSITFWHPIKKIGGMCHYALPYDPFKSDNILNPRFGDECMQLFKRSIIRSGTVISDYHVKIFGGGNMYEKVPNNHIDSVQQLPVGEKNVAGAYQMLSAENVNILVAHVGEFGYRRLIFDISSGDVWVRFTNTGTIKADYRSLSGRK